MKKIVLFFILCIALLPSLRAQDNRELRGTVIDTATDRPLAGATLILQNSGASAVTDDKGRFSLNLSVLPDTLVVRSVGFETKALPVRGEEQADLIIALQSAITGLGEVVVSTGYQSLPAERATGSFTQINNHDLNRQTGSDILARLNGIANSVSFPPQNLDGIPRLMVRGFSTINGPKEPLIVVDNFPYDGDIGNINPNDVESITILKDAAASSIWGARAGNGVIVITTKKGRYNEPMQVHFNSNLTVTGKPDLSNIRTISSSDYIDIEEFLFGKGFYDASLMNTSSYPALSPAVNLLAKARAGIISDEETASRIDKYRHLDIRDQYLKYLYQTGVAQQYAVNFRGGSNRFTYYLSGGYDRTASNLDDKNQRYTFRSVNTFTPVENLTVQLGTQYTQYQSAAGKPGYGDIKVNSVNVPYLRLADEQGHPLPVAKTWSDNYTDTAGNGRLLEWDYYPLTDWTHETAGGKRQDFALDISAQYRLPLDFSFDVKYLYEKQTHSTKNLSDIESYNARNMINQFSVIDEATGLVTYNFPLGGILRLSDESVTVQNVRGQLNFNRVFQAHRVDAFVGAETRQAQTDGHSAVYYGYDGHTLTTANVDYINSYPKYVNGAYVHLPFQQGSLSHQLNRYVSVYENAAWNFKKKYILSGSARKDASNLYGVTSNNKWNLLWSMGAAWIISNEDWYQNKTLPYLKLRATYGFTGNTNPSRSALLTFQRSSPRSGYPGNHSQSVLINLPNPSLHWEKMNTVNFGVDFQSRRNAISGSIEIYFKKGIDLYGPEPQDPTTVGTTKSIIKNIANMKGRGIDVMLNLDIIQTKFKWSSSFNFNYNASQVTKYNVDTSLLSGSLLNPGSRITPLPGKSVYSIVALKWAGLNALGEPQGYLDGKISTDYLNIYNKTKREDLVYRPVLPRYFGSLINDFSYGRFSLSVCINYRLGYYFMKQALSYSQLFSYGAVIGTGDYADRWQKPGDEQHTNVPPMVYPINDYRDNFYRSSEANVLRADNIKLQYISLGCNFNKQNTRWLPFSQGELCVNASNLGLIWAANKWGLDPDYSGPMPGRNLSIGIKANF